MMESASVQLMVTILSFCCTVYGENEYICPGMKPESKQFDNSGYLCYIRSHAACQSRVHVPGASASFDITTKCQA